MPHADLKIENYIFEFQYNNLEATTQKSIAEELDRTPAEVSKKLEDVRTRYAF